jgi:TM2 domain-containing membrane protein YozV
MNEQSVSVKMNMEGKNMIIAYLLWWFMDWAGVHRFYLGRVKTGLAQLLLSIIGYLTVAFVVGFAFLIVWFIWWMLDAYLTFKIVREENEKLGVFHSTISVSKSGDLHNNLDQLEKLHNLFEKGVITKEQYDQKKSTLI